MGEQNIGIIACSGEECLGGTISRLAVRKMMETLRPGAVSTLCLPLFIAGGDQERAFAQNQQFQWMDAVNAVRNGPSRNTVMQLQESLM